MSGPCCPVSGPCCPVSRPRRPRRIGAAIAAGCALLLTACTTTSDTSGTAGSTSSTAASASDVLPPTGTLGSTAAQPSTTPAPTTAPTVDPVTVEGLITGPGIDDASISIGLIVEPTADRGFTSGVDLWAEITNKAGGICGRSLQIVTATAGSAPDAAYLELGRQTVGLITLAPGRAGRELAARVRSDRIPTLTPEGTAGDLVAAGSPLVLGATDDLLAINAASHLLSSGVIPAGGTLGVLIANPATDVDVVAGLTWWANRNDVRLQQLPIGGSVPADLPAVFAAAGPQQVTDLLTATGSASGSGPIVSTGISDSTPPSGNTGTSTGDGPSTDAAAGPTADGLTGSSTGAVESPTGAGGPSIDGAAKLPADGPVAGPIIATTLDGYDPVLIPAGQAGRLLVATVTPSPGADHPTVRAVDSAFVDSGHSDPGPRMLEGYATGEGWTRILEPMCAARTLTRSAAIDQLTKSGPASSESLFGPTSPAAQMTAGLPASRVSALSAADPIAPGGLRPVTLLESAPGIGDYRSG